MDIIACKGRAIEIVQAFALVVSAHDQRTAVMAGRAVFQPEIGRSHQGNAILQEMPERKSTGLAKQKVRTLPEGQQIVLDRGQRIGRRDAFGSQEVARARPQCVKGRSQLGALIHREGGDKGGHNRPPSTRSWAIRSPSRVSKRRFLSLVPGLSM